MLEMLTYLTYRPIPFLFIQILLELNLVVHGFLNFVQSKVGIMVAGCYGMPQFRARCFLWGAASDEVSLVMLSFPITLF